MHGCAGVPRDEDLFSRQSLMFCSIFSGVAFEKCNVLL